jgi:histone H2B
MAPKRRSGGKVVGSVVKTKVVQETVEVTTAIVAGDGEPEQQLAPEALDLAPRTGEVSRSKSKVVHVEVTTPDGDNTTTGGSSAKQKPTGKRGRGGRREEGKAPAPADEAAAAAAEEPPVPQSQETQDPNEEQAEDVDAASKKKRKPLPPPPPPPQQQRQEEQPETPRVASERKTAAAAAAKTTRGGGGADGGKAKAGRRRRRRLGEASPGGDAGMGGVGGYKRYVWRVLKQVHPELGVSGHAMRVLDMMMADMFERLADEAARLSKAAGKATLSSREVQSAVKLVLPGELGRHAMSEGTKAISKYMSYDDAA